MTLIFNKQSWHYRLVVYAFTTEFFFESDGIDIRAMELTDMEKDFKIIYKKKPKVVNLCPYCRAVIAALVTFPFLYVWRLYPHKSKQKRTHAQMMKRIKLQSWIMRIGGAAINIGLGTPKLITGEFVEIAVGIGQIALGALLVTGHWWGGTFVKIMLKIFTIKRKKIKSRKQNIPKHMPKIMQKLEEKHDIICPPIFFIDVEKPEALR